MTWTEEDWEGAEREIQAIRDERNYKGFFIRACGSKETIEWRGQTDFPSIAEAKLYIDRVVGGWPEFKWADETKTQRVIRCDAPAREKEIIR